MTELNPTIFSNWWILAFVLGVVLTGAVVQAGLGMGFGMTVAPILALVDPALVPVPVLFLGGASAALVALKEWRAIAWNEIRLGIVGRLIGLAVGISILISLTSPKTFSLIFGLLIALAVILSVFGRPMAFNRRNLFSMSVISGVMGGITGVGAPPLALVYQNRPANLVRPTIATFFALGCLFGLAGLYGTGWADVTDALVALAIAPAMIVGTLAGWALKGRFDSRYRAGLLSIAAVAALLLILRGIS